jgi:hypothetical protein
MQKGFKKVAPDLIQANPWLTPQEYAKMALDRHLCSSDSENPVFSLATTLMKEVREGRMPGIKGVKVNGRLRYGPAAQTPTNYSTTSSRPDIGVTVVLPPEVAQITDMLVEIEKFSNRGEALVWLAQEGITAREPELQGVKVAHQQIKRLKQSISLY